MINTTAHEKREAQGVEPRALAPQQIDHACDGDRVYSRRSWGPGGFGEPGEEVPELKGSAVDFKGI